MSGHAAQDEEIGQHVDHVDRLQPPCHTGRQTFMREHVDDVQHTVLGWVHVCAIFDEVVRPHVIAMLGLTGWHEPSTSRSGRALGCLQEPLPLSPPNPLDAALYVETHPAVVRTACADTCGLPVAGRYRGHVRRIGVKPFSSSARPWGRVSASSSGAAERRAGTTLGYLGYSRRTCSMTASRRAGLRSFPWRLPAISAWRKSNPKSPCRRRAFSVSTVLRSRFDFPLRPAYSCRQR